MSQNPIKTASGQYIIFDITEFLPGKPIPNDFFQESNGPWYFMPSHWEAPDWGGITIASYRGFPFCYSPGFATAEEALQAAEEWEVTKEKQKKFRR